MLFFIFICLVLLIALPLAQYALKNSGQSRRGSRPSNFSDDSTLYISSASERYGASSDTTASDSSDATTCNDSGSDSDSGSCDSGDSGGSSD